MSHYNLSCHINVCVSSYNICFSILLGILFSLTNKTILTLMGRLNKMGSLCHNKKGVCPNKKDSLCPIRIGSSYNICLSILLGILTSQSNETIPTLLGHFSTRWGSLCHNKKGLCPNRKDSLCLIII